MNHTITLHFDRPVRCSAVIAGMRCTEPSEVRISDSDEASVTDLHACSGHVAHVYRPGQVITYLHRR